MGKQRVFWPFCFNKQIENDLITAQDSDTLPKVANIGNACSDYRQNVGLLFLETGTTFDL